MNVPELKKRVDVSVDGYVIAAYPVGENVLAATGEGELFLLDGATGRTLERVRAHDGGANAAALSPGGAHVVTCGQDGRARVFDARTLVPHADLPSPSAWVEAATFSPKGDLVAIACGRRFRVFGVDGSPVVESEDHPSTVTALTFGRDGKRLATAAYGGVCLFSLAERRTIRRFEWKGSLVSLAMSPDDKVVACGSQDGSVHFWRLSTGRDSAMTGYPFKPKSLAWDSASSLLATGGDTKVTVWDFQGKGPEGTAPIQLDAHKGLVSSLAFAERRALLASGGEETAVFLWEPRKSREPRAFGLTDDVVTSLRFGKSSLVAATAAGRVTVFEM
ncbi:MAG: WD40 repeat domain-containing protein [Polyangiaceae bacterium]